MDVQDGLVAACQNGLVLQQLQHDDLRVEIRDGRHDVEPAAQDKPCSMNAAQDGAGEREVGA